MTPPAPTFPPSNGPRTWLITAAASPIGLRLARALLDHGDNVVLGALASDLVRFPPGFLASNGKDDKASNFDPDSMDIDDENDRADVFARFAIKEASEKGWRAKSKVVNLDARSGLDSALRTGRRLIDGRTVGQCQTAVAEAVATFGGIDVLFCCASEAVVGTVEELAASERTRTLVREQFETNLFGPINIIKAALPAMRERKSGHIISLTGITSHLGTPGLGLFCASGWAIEGFCDSLAYEIAPFNIKLTIVQPNYEIPVLSNKISAAPVLPQYAPTSHPAPLARGMIGSLIDRIEGLASPAPIPPEDPPASSTDRRASATSVMSDNTEDNADMRKRTHVALSDGERVAEVRPRLPQEMLDALVAETVYAVTAIGGHENPPARHIVGHEGVASVKEKLKTVSEELEDFVDCSGAVDIEGGGGEGM